MDQIQLESKVYQLEKEVAWLKTTLFEHAQMTSKELAMYRIFIDQFKLVLGVADEAKQQ